jgi:hypothetical protein
VLHAGALDLVDVQEVGGVPVLVQAVLGHLEPDAVGVGVALGDVVHRDRDAVGTGGLFGHRFAEVGREGRDPALPGQIVPDERDIPFAWTLPQLNPAPWFHLRPPPR